MNKAEILEIANDMETISVCKRQHVIATAERRSTFYPEPNYLGTGKAFLGVLKNYETLEEFRDKWIKQKFELHKIH